MWKLKSYLLPANDYLSINYEMALDFADLVEKVCLKDTLIIPQELYVYLDKNAVSAADYLFGQKMDDVSQYLYEIISKQTICDDNYDDLLGNILELKGSFMKFVNKIDMNGIDEYLIESAEDIVKMKRIYINLVNSYQEFEEMAIDCYPNLVFHPDAFTRIHKLGNINDVIKELTRHINILCDEGKALYNECLNNEKMTLDMLKTKHSITCSGKGSNENIEYNKKLVITEVIIENGIEKRIKTEYNLTCNPHTKFFDGNNDQRIYFCWGRREIKNHDIIIVHIGDHWEKSS